MGHGEGRSDGVMGEGVFIEQGRGFGMDQDGDTGLSCGGFGGDVVEDAEGCDGLVEVEVKPVLSDRVEEELKVLNYKTRQIFVAKYGLRDGIARSYRGLAQAFRMKTCTVTRRVEQARATLNRRWGPECETLKIAGLSKKRSSGKLPLNTPLYPTKVVVTAAAKARAERAAKERAVAAVDAELEARREVLRTDYERALETECTVRREDGQEVPVVLRVPQRRYVRMRQRLRDELGQVKVVEVKCRQYGSTWVKSACFALDLVNFPGSRLLIVADDKAKSEHVARDYVYAVLLSIDERLRGKVSKFAAKMSGECFTLENGSSCMIGTANRAAQLAKSWTAHFGLFTEAATWCLKMGNSQRADEALLAVLQCFPDPTIAPQVCIDLESTAYGMGGLFAETYRKTKNPDGKTDGWTGNFSPWYELEKYSVADPKAGWSQEAEARIQKYRELEDKEAAKALELDDAEKNLVFENKEVTWANILWRRMYGLPKCQGDIYKFQQEYPSNDVEAFQFSGSPVFSPHSIGYFEKQAKEQSMWPVEILVRSPSVFELSQVEASASEFELYKWPEVTSGYFIGADIAQGSASMYGDDRSMAKKARNDASVASVWEQETGEQVLEFVGYPDPEEFGDILWKLALIFNRAVVNPERNTFGGETLKRLYRDLRYEKVFMYLSEKWEGKGGMPVPGMPVHVDTRSMLLDKFRVAVKKKIAKPRSLGLLREMSNVQRNEMTGKIDHPRQGSDDRIFAASHAWWAMTDANLRLSGDVPIIDEDVPENPLGLPVAWSPGQKISPRVERGDGILDPWR
jgi:hypothetical protein